MFEKLMISDEEARIDEYSDETKAWMAEMAEMVEEGEQDENL